MINTKVYLTAALIFAPLSVLATVTHSAPTDYGILLAQAETDSTTVTDDGMVYGPVHKKEYLWSISRAFKTDDNTMSQIVMSIFLNNPEAFYQNNINRLKVNAVLSIPDDTAIKKTDYGSAYQAVISHIEEYERFLESENSILDSKSMIPDPFIGQTALIVSIATTAESLLPDESEVESPIEMSNVELDQIDLIKEALQEEVKVAQAVVPTEKPREKKSKKSQKPKRPLFNYSYDFSSAYDDNIRKAQSSGDIREDVITSFALKARGGMPIDSFTLFNYGGEISYDLFNDFDTLNSLNYNINARYRFALSSGFTSPIYTFSAKLGGIESDQEMRDSSLVSVAFNVNKWITNTINMTTGVEIRTHDSKSEVFDLSEGRFFLNLDLNLNKTDLVYTTYTFISGDTVSSASPRLAIINAADAIEPDDAFGGITTNQFAYRLDADTQVLTFGYNKIMSRTISIDLSARLVDTEAADGIGYERTILRASLLGRF
ncbi:MAG: FimV-like protein [Gammaproteobacteria bacterium]|jgi:FimV-like protein